MQRLQTVLLQCAGWLLYMSLLMLIALALPADIFDSQSKHFIFLVGAVGIWRYSMGATHFIRGMIFLYIVYPYLRRKVQKMGDATAPSHVYLMVTSFRIEALTTAQVYSR
ncbi:Mannuronan synthase [Pseudomonas sp. MM221]|nr:Mannuronan synthase [Pseudomonas sp. MM223]CAI3809437.1 Mannuronan synthase [Pseudomonas sp. MM221]